MRSLKATLLFALMMSASYAQTPVIADGGILNGASFARGQGVSPGSLVSLFGTELAASLAQGDTIPLSTVIGNVSVTMNGVSAPLYFVSPGQINAQVPWELAGAANLNVVVQRGGASSAAAVISQAAAAPGLFMVPNSTQAIAINTDGSLAAPDGFVQGSHPAKAGDVLVIYGTGFGAVDPPIQSGFNSIDQLRRSVISPIVTIGGVSSAVAFAGLTPEFPGVNQLNIVVPAGVAPGGSVPITIQMSGASHQATLAIQ